MHHPQGWGHPGLVRLWDRRQESQGASFEAIEQGLEEKIVQGRVTLMQVGACEKGISAEEVFKRFKGAQEKVGGNATMAQQSFMPKWMPIGQQGDLSAGARDI